MTKVQKSQYNIEEHQIWLNTGTIAHGSEEKKWFLRLWPWENSFLLQDLAIISTRSTWRTHQLNVSFPLTWCTSEHSTQYIVLLLVLPVSEEGNQPMWRGKNIIFLIFLHFLTCDLKYIAIQNMIKIFFQDKYMSMSVYYILLNFFSRTSESHTFKILFWTSKPVQCVICIHLAIFISKWFRYPTLFLKSCWKFWICYVFEIS